VENTLAILPLKRRELVTTDDELIPIARADRIGRIE
jgi:hypothetical protein